MKTIVTKLEEHSGGPLGSYWTARVSINGSTVPVDNRHGAWDALVKENGAVLRKELLPQIAATVQDRLPSKAKAKRR